jgi:septal ring factor EnvC (AmiA/AmiB activator)
MPRRQNESYRTLAMLCRQQAMLSSSAAARRELEEMAREYRAMAAWTGNQSSLQHLDTRAEGTKMAGEKEAERVESAEQDYPPRCPACAAFSQFRTQFLEPVTGRTIRLYQCQCGQRIWED